MTVRKKIAATVLLLLAAVAWAAEVPRRSPDFQIHMLNGTSVQLSQYRGKIIALAFLKPS
jgi:hypothetical protein